MNIALITAGGMGSRTGLPIPKQFIKVYGKPLLIYTLEAFQENPRIDVICLVCHKDWMDYAMKCVKRYRLSKVKVYAEGSDTFNNSIRRGVYELCRKGYPDDSVVLIHESNRPLVSQRIIDENIDVCLEYDYVTTAIKSPHVIMRTDGETVSDIDVPRSDMVSIQSPNTYRLGFLYELYNRCDSKGIVATTGMVNRYTDHKHHIVWGDEYNGLKITTSEDFVIFKKLIYGRFTLHNIARRLFGRRD